MQTRLLLARHGQTEWHAENRYAGTSEVALTSHGTEQAEGLASYLAALPAEQRPSALYCSPQDRAVRTADPAAKALRLTAEIVDELHEVHFGIAEGKTLDELRRTDPEAVDAFLADPVAGAFPGAEPTDQAADRGVAALRSIAARANGELVLVVAHNTLFRLTLCRLLGIPLHTYRTVFPRVRNAALTEIGIDGERTALLRFNQPTT
ncbi:histidine phosphatase family protein [Amycolatopsis nigrescens]|uniref:histidine phosphatase family protein n=1 Tax=Amycolatopsis nigrescens TaxID=381445 RepID=UPI00037E4753|nr:histidine phosphatase family protein [Amycolatopsis nigrescens]